MTQHKRNTAGIRQHANEKRLQTKEKVLKTLEKLLLDKETINYNTVALQAGVSKTYLYSEHELRQTIAHYRKKQKETPSPKAVKRNMNGENKDALIHVQRSKIHSLQEEVEKLKGELRRFQSMMYEKI